MKNLYIENYPGISDNKCKILPSLFHARALTRGIELIEIYHIETVELCSEYIAWYYQQILEDRIHANPELTKQIVNYLALLLFEESSTEKEIINEIEDDTQRSAAKKALIRTQFAFLACLPQCIKDKLGLNKYVYSIVENNFGHILTIGSYEFDFLYFFEQASKAMSGKIVQLIDKKGNNINIKFELSQEDNLESLSLTTGIEEKKIIVTSPVNCIFYSDSERRKSCMIRYANDFDYSQEQMSSIADGLFSEQDPWILYDMVLHLSLNSCNELYRAIPDRLSQNNKLILEDILPPSADALLRFLRLAPNEPQGKAFDLAASRLLNEVGMAETLRRFSGLPRPFPSPLINGLERMSMLERESCIQQWAANPCYPLFIFHFVRIVLHFSLNQKDSLSKHIEKHLCHAAFPGAMNLFKSLLNWSSNIVCSFPEAQEWPYWLRLAVSWSHASQLTSLTLKYGIPDEGLENFLQRNSRGLPLQDLLFEAVHGQDVASPRKFNTSSFTLAGLAYALGGSGEQYLTDNALKLLKDLALTNIEGKLFPDVAFFGDLLLANNCLNSFLSQSMDTIIQTLQIKDLEATNWAPDVRIKEYQQLIGSIDILPEVKVTTLMAAFSFISIPDSCKESFFSLFSEFNFLDYIKSEDELAFANIFLASKFAAKYKNSTLIEHIKSTAHTLVVEREAIFGSKQISKKIAFTIFENLFHLALGAGNIDAYLHNFMSMLDELIAIDYELIPHVLTILEKHCAQLPVECSHDVWQMIIRLRSYNFRNNFSL